MYLQISALSKEAEKSALDSILLNSASKAVKTTPSQSIQSDSSSRISKSTGGIVRKYRLSLNKEIRDKYTRKKLIFNENVPPDENNDQIPQIISDTSQQLDDYSNLLLPNELVPPDEKNDQIPQINSDTSQQLDAYSNLLLLPIEDQISQLEQQISTKRANLLILQRHETEVAAIRADIDTWEKGFRTALDKLCILRPYSAQQILQQLGIPNDLIQY